jgi:hypothetical protein
MSPCTYDADRSQASEAAGKRIRGLTGGVGALSRSAAPTERLRTAVGEAQAVKSSGNGK